MSRAAGRALLTPPARVRGARQLERALYTRRAPVPALALTLPAARLARATRPLRAYLLKLDNFKPVRPDLGCAYLDPGKVARWEDLAPADRSTLAECEIDETCFATREIEISYENWRSDQIFKATLPEDVEGVSGFSQVGHVVHLNLKDQLQEYKSLIGSVLLDKVKTCRTVVNKSSSIDNTYRNFAMEVLAGDEDFHVTVKENNCVFEFDFSKVYWNPRLGKEHDRIRAMLSPHSDVLFDVFCGVGPFAIPALKKKCKVFANDLNPESFKWLNHNAKRNKVNDELFKSYNMDGRDFIKGIFKCYLLEVFNGSELLCDDSKIHITMNLPAMAVEFLDTFNGLLKDFQFQGSPHVEIIVHVYCFAVGDTPEATAKEMVNKNIGTDITNNIVEVKNVRNVAPKKEMMRVSFKLSKDLLKGETKALNEIEPPSKKLCV